MKLTAYKAGERLQFLRGAFKNKDVSFSLVKDIAKELGFRVTGSWDVANQCPIFEPIKEQGNGITN